MKKYVFKSYNVLFPTLFEQEKKRLSTHLSKPYEIEHIGSTAIPGLGGKGIIDIYIVVDKKRVKQISKELQEAGYEFREKASKIHNHLFHKISLPDILEEFRTYHVHVTYSEEDDWRSAIAFRNYLRQNPEEVKKYAEIKKIAAEKAHEDKDKYMKKKSPLMQEILQKALQPLK